MGSWLDIFEIKSAFDGDLFKPAMTSILDNLAKILPKYSEELNSVSSDSSSDTENSGDTNDSTDSDSVAQKVMGVLDNLPQPLEDNVRATLEKISENGSTTDLLLNFY